MYSEDAIEAVKLNLEYGYHGRIDEIRREEYSHMGGICRGQYTKTDNPDTIYLDHAGATLYPASVIQDHSRELITNLFSNPHSRSPSSVNTTNRITETRRRVLELFNADPDLFDVVFVANATAGIKLIGDGFCGSRNGFRYKYLRDAHTSLVGVGGVAREAKCLSEKEVREWLS